MFELTNIKCTKCGNYMVGKGSVLKCIHNDCVNHQNAERENVQVDAFVSQKQEPNKTLDKDFLLAEFDKQIEKDKKPFGAFSGLDENTKEFNYGFWEGVRYSRTVIKFNTNSSK